MLSAINLWAQLHETLEQPERHPLADKIRNDPKVEGKLRQPDRLLDRQKETLDVIHRRLAIHRVVLPHEPDR